MTPEATAIQLLFHIQNKQGKRVPFRLNHAQTFLDNTETNRILIAKARQHGFSSYALARNAIKCLGVEGTRAVVMSHEKEATQRLLDKVQYYFKWMNGPKPKLGRNSRNELTFDKTDSTFYIGTAGARAFGRGDTITDLHCSEYAWWEDTEVHKGGVFEAVPITGRIVIESTGNGRNNDFYRKWKSSDDYARLFYPWFAGTEYEIHDAAKWKPDIPSFNGYLLELQAKHKLSDAKMKWYTWKLKDKEENIRVMQQEYPSTPDECFQASGGALFPNVEATDSVDWQPVKHEGYYVNCLVNHPKPGWTYVIGVDPSGGTGNDDAAIVIFATQTGEQVLEFTNKYISPPQLTTLLLSLANKYNNAFIVPEANNHGITVVDMLKAKYNKSLIFKRKFETTSSPPLYGWMNSKQTKHALIGMMQEDLPSVTIYGKGTQAELSAFEETSSGRMEGESDNLVIACGLALLGLKKFMHLRGSHIPLPVAAPKPKPNYMTFTLDDVLKNIRQRSVSSSYFHRRRGRAHD
jgi:hypothetical protein